MKGTNSALRNQHGDLNLELALIVATLCMAVIFGLHLLGVNIGDRLEQAADATQIAGSVWTAPEDGMLVGEPGDNGTGGAGGTFGISITIGDSIPGTPDAKLVDVIYDGGVAKAVINSGGQQYVVAPGGTIPGTNVVVGPVGTPSGTTPTQASAGAQAGATITDPDGNPLHATVVVSGPGGTQTGETDANGYVAFTFDTLGHYDVQVSADGYAPLTGDVNVSSFGGFYPLTFNLPVQNVLASATLTIRDTDGTPLPGGTVTLAGRTVTADLLGVARFSGLAAGTRSGSASADGYATRSFSITLVAGQNSVGSVALTPLDTTAPFTVSDATSFYTGTAVITLSATDEESGVAHTYYELDGSSDPQVGTVVTVAAGGATNHILDFWSVDNEGNVEDRQTVTFTVNPLAHDGSMTITTLDGAGQPKILRVVITGPNAYYRDNLWSNASGIVSVPNLVPGSYQVRAFTNPTGLEFVTVNAGANSNITVRQAK